MGSEMCIRDSGKSETDSGQIVTGTQANRSVKTTGNEASTCRTVTGTQYMGAEVVDQFCQERPSYKQPLRSTVTSTTSGNKVTGNEVGRSERVTGDEPGTCKNLTVLNMYLLINHRSIVGMFQKILQRLNIALQQMD